MKLSELPVVCDQCHQTSILWVNEIEGYSGTILRSFWCKNQECKKPQVIRYKFVNTIPEVTEHIEPTLVNVEQQPVIGISIRPRGKTR